MMYCLLKFNCNVYNFGWQESQTNDLNHKSACLEISTETGNVFQDNKFIEALGIFNKRDQILCISHQENGNSVQYVFQRWNDHDCTAWYGK